MNEYQRLDVDTIKADLDTSLIGKEVLVYKCTSSTNNVAWEYSKNKKNNGLVVFAEEQTSGRGRMGNKWLGGYRKSILFSVLVLNCRCESELLTLASGIAVTEAVSKFSRQDAKIKWPNDVVIDHKKVAGILLESQTRQKQSDYVIGIGINCHQHKEFFAKAKFQMPATSIDIESDQVVDRNLVAKEVLVWFDKWLKTAKSSGEKIIERWRQLSSQLGHRVTLQYDQKQFNGNCIGVDPVKGLILQLDNGGVRMFDAAHTTIVKQHG